MVAPKSSPGDEPEVWASMHPAVEDNRLPYIELHQNKDSYLFGRAVKGPRDVKLDGMHISNTHALVKWSSEPTLGSATVFDLGSTNGVFVNGERLPPKSSRVLEDGDELALAQPRCDQDIDYRWVFYYASAWAAPADTSARYELGKRLGQGAFGTVYCATDRAGCTLVAVKMFDRRRYRTHARFGGDTNLAVEIFVRDFAQEVAMLRLLEHPFLVRMLEQTVIDGNNSLVFEYANGGSLTNWFNNFIKVNSGALLEDEAKVYAHQIASALHYLHSHGVAHRDLKPCNVLIFLPPNVDPDSRLGRATIGTCKLGDFGQCAIFEEAIMERTSCGTHGFRAPEMIAQQPYGPISDVFALGVIVCGLITGWYPSYEDDRVRAPKGWTWKEYLAAMLHEAQISEACSRLLVGLLEVDYNLRWDARMALQSEWLSCYDPDRQSPVQSQADGLSRQVRRDASIAPLYSPLSRGSSAASLHSDSVAELTRTDI